MELAQCEERMLSLGQEMSKSALFPLYLSLSLSLFCWSLSLCVCVLFVFHVSLFVLVCGSACFCRSLSLCVCARVCSSSFCVCFLICAVSVSLVFCVSLLLLVWGSVLPFSCLLFVRALFAACVVSFCPFLPSHHSFPHTRASAFLRELDEAWSRWDTEQLRPEVLCRGQVVPPGCALDRVALHADPMHGRLVFSQGQLEVECFSHFGSAQCNTGLCEGVWAFEVILETGGLSLSLCVCVCVFVFPSLHGFSSSFLSC